MSNRVFPSEVVCGRCHARIELVRPITTAVGGAMYGPCECPRAPWHSVAPLESLEMESGPQVEGLPVARQVLTDG